MQPAQFARHVGQLVERREPFAIATVTRTEGSTLAKPGFKILIAPSGAIVAGTLGGGCPEGPVVAGALEALELGEPRVLRVHLVDTEASLAGTARGTDPNEIWVQTNCGGTLELYIEPMLPSRRLVIVGQGGRDDVEEALVHLGMRLGFEVIVIDPNPSLSEAPHELLRESTVDVHRLGLGALDSVIVLTKGERDVAVLESLSHVPLRFVGLLASRHRLRQDTEELVRRGVPPEFVRALHAPIGLDIGAKTPEELGVAILAEVIQTHYDKATGRRPSTDRTDGA
ncbi:MAG TPA: XdhC family protein [Thermoplasmata archaeon]|nr:XdhC family protein [Thermoplasmata archaeon]